jgi:hypothetical protein
MRNVLTALAMVLGLVALLVIANMISFWSG